MSHAGAVQRNPGDPLIGSVIGARYSIRKLIGRGGVGLVYLATQKGEDPGARDVVVKVLAPHWASDPETVARFSREVKRLSTLRHPNIVEMLDHGTDGDRPYLVMEYCAGELLSDYVDRNRALTLEQFVPIAAQLLKGVGHCHSREMMVRDIKPANVMLVERKGRANFVKLLDFGLAKLIKGDEKVTEEHVIGTVGYLSPEQIKGEELDLRVDVYALGVMFYYMLAGRLPFDGADNATVFYATINQTPPDLRRLLPADHEVPEGLIDLIHECLEKDRSRRPADADEIVERLIDVVPAATFRLPKADTGRHAKASNSPPIGHGNTGMIELLGTERSPTTQLPRHAADTEVGPLPHAETVRLEGARTSKTPVLIASAAAVLAGLLAAWGLTRGEPTPAPVTAASIEPADDDDTAARLDTAQRSIETGELDRAQSLLDAIVVQPGSAEAVRLDRLAKRLEVARLLTAAEALETSGNIPAALAAYRDALQLDPTHVQARSAVARLEVPGPTTDVVAARVAIDSTPDGELYIDGRAIGRTPYEGELAPGPHAIEIRARGYETWSGELQVTEAGARPVAVALDKVRRGRTGKPRASESTSSAPDVASPPPPPAPSPAPAAAAKPGPFLDTKDKHDNRVFLSTKD